MKRNGAYPGFTLKDFTYLTSDEYRRSHNPFGNKPSPVNLSTGNCNFCPCSVPMNNKAKGKRVPGGFGKCTRPEGPCANPVPRLGIGGVASSYKEKGETV